MPATSFQILGNHICEAPFSKKWALSRMHSANVDWQSAYPVSGTQRSYESLPAKYPVMNEAGA